MLDLLVSRLLGGGKSRKELEALEGATTMLAGYAAKDFNAAFATMVQALRQIDNQERSNPKKRAKAFLYAEDTSRRYYHQLLAQLVRLLERQELSAHNLYHMVLGYQDALITCYQSLLVADSALERTLGKGVAPQIFCRTLALIADSAMVRMLRYEALETAQWGQVNRLYAQAEQLGLQRVAVAPYGGKEGERSIEQEFLRMQLLYLSQPECLTPLQIATLNDWLQRNLTVMQVDQDLAPEAQSFVLGLEGFRPPAQLRKREEGADKRYLNTRPLIARAQNMVKQLQQGQDCKALALPTAMTPRDALAMFDRVSRCWSRSHYPKRRDERQATPELVLLYQGVPTILETIKSPPEPSQSQASFSTRVHSRAGVSTVMVDESMLSDTASSSMWLLEDISSQGIGLRQHNTVAKRPAINDLLAVRYQHKLRIGVVRRVAMEDGRQYIGVEIVAEEPQMVHLRSVSGVTLEAVFAVGQDEGQRFRTLLLPSQFEPRPDPYTLLYKGREYQVTLSADVRFYSGGNLFPFTVVEQKAA